MGLDLETISRGYFVGGIIGGFFSLLLLVTVVIFPGTRQHPAEFKVISTLCDVVVAGSFIVSYPTHLPIIDADPCKIVAAVNHYALVASSAWIFACSIDMLLAIRNPFVDHKMYTVRHHIFVWGSTAAMTAAVLMSNNYGVSSFGFCWIKSTSDVQQFNIWSWIFFFFPVAMFWFISLIITVVASLAFRKGLYQSSELRRGILKQGLVYVVGYGIYWSFAGSVWAAQYFVHYQSERVIPYLFAATIALRGVVDWIAWTFVNYKHFTFSRPKKGTAEEGERLFGRQLHEGLRADVMMCTAMGIVNAAEKAGRGDGHLSANDFTEKQHLKIPRKAQSTGADAPEFEFWAHAPRVFASLRRIFSLSPDDYCSSFVQYRQETSDGGAFSEVPLEDQAEERRSTLNNADSYRVGIFKERFTEGRSNAFLYFCHDSRFIVKTVEKHEMGKLLAILNDYHAHMNSHIDKSILCKVLGLYSIRLYSGNAITYFVVIENAFANAGVINARYDLKGSTVNRRVIKDGEPSRAKIDGKPVLKDLDLTDRIKLDTERRALFIEAMQLDSNFLASVGVMDYSLLVGVQNRGARGPDLYYLCIIDILQEWDKWKKLERFFKTKILRKDPDGISAVPPNPYCVRFQAQMEQIVDDDE